GAGDRAGRDDPGREVRCDGGAPADEPGCAGAVIADPRVEALLRELAPQVLGAVVRRFGHFDACEDAVQEALLAAAVQWPVEGVPENPRGWLSTVAARRLTDQWRSELARRRRESGTAGQAPPGALVAPAADEAQPSDQDDTLTLLFLC